MGRKWSIKRFWKQSPTFRKNIEVQSYFFILTIILSFVIGILTGIIYDRYINPVLFPVSPPDVTIHGGCHEVSGIAVYNHEFYGLNGTKRFCTFFIDSSGVTECVDFGLFLSFEEETILRVETLGEYPECYTVVNKIQIYRNDKLIATTTPLEPYRYQKGDSVFGTPGYVSFHCSRIGTDEHISFDVCTLKDVLLSSSGSTETKGYAYCYYKDHYELRKKLINISVMHMPSIKNPE